ncbi:MAG: hypothetical protein LAT76_04580 [Schleiferiaceae bacterium]|nr:hypothetical protein [Schleiferiaceae bacterium]
MKYLITSLFLFSLFFISCDRDKSVQGPLLDDIYGEFSLLEPFTTSTNAVDFSTGEQVVFEATFGKQVNWEIHIEGQTSGAKRIIEGFSSTINATNAVWNGRTNVLPMFKTEPCRAYLLVPNEDNFSSDTLSISVLGERVTPGFVVTDFESGFNSGWNTFLQSGANMNFRIVESPLAAQGNFYYEMGGEVPFDFLIGLIEFPASAQQLQRYPLSTNPNNVYFNVFLYKPENIRNEFILFRFLEDDNEDGTLQNNEDVYSFETRSLQPGWQQISIRYSDLVNLVNGQPAPPAGNGVLEPHKLARIDVLLLADPSTGYSQLYMDNLIFTENQPLQP